MKEVEVSIERDGKYVFAVAKLDDKSTRVRVPLHVLHLEHEDPESFAWHMAEIAKVLRRRVALGRGFT